LPPINPTIAPKPIFQVVVHVSNRLIWRGDGVKLNDNTIDVTRDKVVNETTVKKTHLKSEIEFFIPNTPNDRKGCGGCYAASTLKDSKTATSGKFRHEKN
jgi:hypothetical protein